MIELTKRPLIVAHRGCSGTFPENTMISFKRAIEIGADMIELDVQTSKDGKVIVFHDKELRRTTNGIGKINNLTYKELQNLDAGSWFAKEFKGEQIPLLRDVLRLIKGKIKLNIEIKSYGNYVKHNFIVENTIELVREYKMEEDVLFTSFDHKLIREYFEFHPDLHVGVLYDRKRHFNKTPSILKKNMNIEAFVLDIRDAKIKLIESARNCGLIVGVYSIDTEISLEKALKLKTDVIVSNFPEHIFRWLGKLK